MTGNQLVNHIAKRSFLGDYPAFFNDKREVDQSDLVIMPAFLERNLRFMTVASKMNERLERRYRRNRRKG